MRNTLLSYMLLWAALVPLITGCALPPPPEDFEGEIILSIPEDQVHRDTIGSAVKFYILHTFTDYLDSIVVSTSDGLEPRILRITKFVSDTTRIEWKFNSPGTKSVEVVAYYVNGTTASGRSSLEIIERPGDLDGPTLVISTPKNGAIISQTTVEVTGTVWDASGISLLTVNGETVVADSQRTWSVIVPLDPGSNQIRLVAVDNSPVRNQTVVEFAVTCNPNAPPEGGKHILTINPAQGGSTIPSGGSTLSVNRLASTAISAIPDSGYFFIGWKIVSGNATLSDSTAAMTTARPISDTVVIEAKYNSLPMFVDLPLQDSTLFARVYELPITVFDRDNEASSLKITLRSSPVDMSILNGKIVWKIDTEEFTNGQVVAVVIRVTDPLGGFTESTIRIKVGLHV